MPIENLTADAQLDWASRGAAAAVVYDLAGAKEISAKQVHSLSDAQSMQASRLLEGYFFLRNGRASIRATVQDLAKTKTLESWDIDGDAAAGFLPLANELARKLSSAARTFGTSNQTAFQLYGAAMAAKDSNGAEQALQQAIAADPGFAAAYLEQAKLLIETGNRERARQVTEAGQRARLDSIDRADLEYVAANASGDANGRMKALESLTAVTPANADIFLELGQMRFAGRQFQQAAMEYRAAARLVPEDTQIWNELGYALAWNKDLSGAREALGHYQELAPGDTNALDSQGEVSYMLGDFKAAEEYFQRAAAKNPSEFLKAAEARLMMGDLSGADALFAKHLGRNASGRSTGAEYQIAQWEFLTGRRSAGLNRMEKLAGGLNGDFQALALSQLAVWRLEMGDRKAAEELVQKAATGTLSPQARATIFVTGLIVDGRASSGSKMADAYAFLFQKNYREALPLLQAVFNETNPSADGAVRTLLAWAYVETGEVDKAANLTGIYPLPLPSGEPLFASLIFPRYLMVRSAVLEHQGKGDEAKRSRALYMKYGGATS